MNYFSNKLYLSFNYNYFIQYDTEEEIINRFENLDEACTNFLELYADPYNYMIITCEKGII